MTTSGSLSEFAVKSYRYLRLAIVILVVSLIASVLIERAHSRCWQESISAYYYTPVHAVFVGALVAIGVCLIAIKGSTEWEDVLLNVAGMLAPVVAFVPTSPPTSQCTMSAYVGGDVEAYINNNVLALAIGGGIAVGLALLIAKLQGKVDVQRVDRPSRVGIALGVVLIVAGLVWYGFGRASFLQHAHGTAAAAMFTLIGVVLIINVRHARPPYRWIYLATVGFMVLAAVAVGIIGAARPEWGHKVLWLEFLQIVPFAAFWSAQTLELWNGGVRRRGAPESS